jgi:ABC-type metal ion transport system substrate-binding protein
LCASTLDVDAITRVVCSRRRRATSILPLAAALRSPSAKKFIQDKYHGAVVATF